MLKQKLIHRTRILRAVLALLLLMLAYLLIGAVLPSRRHKSVSLEYAEQFSPDALYASDVGPERVACIDDCDEALLWRLQLIRQAQEELVLSTFDFRPDQAGLDVMAALWDAAERGVQVRVLIDGINGVLYLSGSDEMRALAAHPNVEVRLYNKINLLKPWKAQYRLHDKYVIADRTAYLLGGRNTNELFLGQTDGAQNIDRELLVYESDAAKGTSMDQLWQYFEAIWADPSCQVLGGKVETDAGQTLADRFLSLADRFPDAFRDPDWAQCTLDANRITLLSNPTGAVNKEPTLWYAITALMQGSQEVLIETPYMICSEEMRLDLAAVCDSGSRVHILTNATENGANPFGCSDYLRRKSSILETGAAVYEFSGDHSRHTKTILIDGRMSLVGSFNLDMRSAYLDTELMLAVDSSALNALLRAQNEAACEQSRLALPDGEYEYGSRYDSHATSGVKLFLYKTLSLLLGPIRHLL